MQLTELKDFANIVQAFFTSLAILIGGVWSYMLFVRKRQKYPRASIKHRIVCKPITNNKLLLHVAITIKSTGEVLLSLVSGEIHVQQVLPPTTDLLGLIDQGLDPVEEGRCEVSWPMVCSREFSWTKGEIEIEPGESDEFCYDFIIDASIKTIEVYSYFKNAKKRKSDIGWGLTTVYDIPVYEKNQLT